MNAPNLLILTPIVKQDKLALRHSGEESLNALWSPCGLIEIEHPSHLQPCGLRVDVGEGAIDALSHCGKVGGVFRRQLHLIEGVDAVDMVGAELLNHLADVAMLYLSEEAVLRVEEVAKWRGDSNITSMSDYIHTNREMLDLYKKYSFRYQESLLREVLDD